MNLVKWEPAVYQKERRPGKTVPMFQIRSWLRCPFCGQLCEVASEATMLNHVPSADGRTEIELGSNTYLDTPESRTYSAITQIKQQRSCGECGLVSIIPPAQVEQFRGAVLRAVTVEWIEQQIEALRQPQLRPHDQHLAG